jgi:ABC-2 type transport system ATP-binding protein
MVPATARSDALIRVAGLTRRYGRLVALSGLDLEVLQGEVFGYLGPNGAGKTTTIRILLDLIRASDGTATIFGLDSRRDGLKIRRRVGYLPGEMALYENLTGRQFLSYFASLRGGVEWRYVEELAERFSSDLRPRIRTLSHGNRQKLGLIQAFMHRPELVVLDEPTTGLDPLMQHEFYSLIADARRAGQTVFLSSHVIPEIERTCDRVAILRTGKLVTVERISALKAKAIRHVEIRFARPVPADAFANLPGTRDLTVRDEILRCAVLGSMDQLVKAAARFEVIEINSEEPSLEELFLTYYEPSVQATPSPRPAPSAAQEPASVETPPTAAELAAVGAKPAPMATESAPTAGESGSQATQSAAADQSASSTGVSGSEATQSAAADQSASMADESEPASPATAGDRDVA